MIVSSDITMEKYRPDVSKPNEYYDVWTFKWYKTLQEHPQSSRSKDRVENSF